MIATHLNGFFLCASEAVPRMVAQGRRLDRQHRLDRRLCGPAGPRSLLRGEGGHSRPDPRASLEVATAGVRVNAVAPGFTRTKLIEQGLADGSLQEDWMVARVPMKRLAAPQEIANAVRWLAGDEASYVTGQTIVVDGGWTMQGLPQAPSWLKPSAEKRSVVEARR